MEGAELLSYFTNEPFFNSGRKKAFHYSVVATLTDGEMVKVRTLVGEINYLVIRPMDNETLKQYTIKQGAILNVADKLNFFNTTNTSDIILWDGRFYRVLEMVGRVYYGYKYILEYLYEDTLDA